MELIGENFSKYLFENPKINNRMIFTINIFLGTIGKYNCAEF